VGNANVWEPSTTPSDPTCCDTNAAAIAVLESSITAIEGNTINISSAIGGISAPESYTVGAGKDYETLSAALLAHGARKPLVDTDGTFTPATPPITLVCDANFLIEEQIHVTGGMDLSHITITSANDIILVDRASLTLSYEPLGEGTDFYPAFFFDNGSKSPIFKVLLTLNDATTYVLNYTMILAAGGSLVQFYDIGSLGTRTYGVADCGNYGIYLVGSFLIGRRLLLDDCFTSLVANRGSVADLKATSLTDTAGGNNGIGVILYHGSYACLDDVIINNRTYAVRAERGSKFTSYNGDFLDCTTYAIELDECSIADIDSPTVSTSGTTGRGIKVTGNSQATIRSATIDNCTDANGALIVTNGGRVYLGGASSLDNASGIAINVAYGGEISIDGGSVSITGATTTAVHASFGATVQAYNLTASGTTADFHINYASIMKLTSCTGGLTADPTYTVQAANAINASGHGIIYDF